MNKTQIVGLVLLGALVMGLLGMYYGKAVSYSEADLQEAVENAVEEVKAEMYTSEEVDAKITQATEGLLTPEQVQEQLDELQEQIDEKDAMIEQLQEELETASEIIDPEGYLLDGLRINDAVPTKAVSDREIDLFDGTVEVDDEDINAVELLRLEGLFLEANGVDFKEDVLLTVPEEGIKYQFILESKFDRSLVTEDEPLMISLLGEEAKIVEWSANKIVMQKGEKFLFEEGEIKEIEGAEVEIIIIHDDYVYLRVNDETEKITEGDSATVGGIEIFANEVLCNDDGLDLAELRIGESIEEVIEAGDEFEEDSVWEWQINPRRIILFNTEEFKYLDEDEPEFNALNAGEQICLPNEFICIRYDGLLEEPTEEYTFDIYTKGGVGDFVRARGNFVEGLNDYSRIYINDTGIYDTDFNLIGTKVKLADTKASLEIVDFGWGNRISIDDLRITMDLKTIRVGASILLNDEDDNYRTDYGIIVFNPEDSVEDQKIRIEVPEEKLEASITIL
jgi:hypothetical protein